MSGLWIALGKCQAVSENVRDSSENVRIERTQKTPQTRMNKGFAAGPRARARKTRKNYIKTWAQTTKKIPKAESTKTKDKSL
jgi:hypothetical protein